jgi:hypothetical protein
MACPTAYCRRAVGSRACHAGEKRAEKTFLPEDLIAVLYHLCLCSRHGLVRVHGKGLLQAWQPDAGGSRVPRNHHRCAASLMCLTVCTWSVTHRTPSWRTARKTWGTRIAT